MKTTNAVKVLRNFEKADDVTKADDVAVHFCNKRRLHPDPELLLYGTRIPVVPETK